jgi:hypothetical protein
MKKSRKIEREGKKRTEGRKEGRKGREREG